MNKNEFLRWHSLEEFKNLERFYNKKEVFLSKVENFKKQNKEKITQNFFGDDTYKNNFGFFFDEDGEFLCICKMYKEDYENGFSIYYGDFESFPKNSLVEDFYKTLRADLLAQELKKLYKKEIIFLKRYEIKQNINEIENLIFKDMEKLFEVKETF